jgi:hypothetical protein
MSREERKEPVRTKPSAETLRRLGQDDFQSVSSNKRRREQRRLRKLLGRRRLRDGE